MDEIKVKLAENEKEISESREVRKQVFQMEQGIDSKLDFDGKDDEADQFIAYFNNKAVGTIRIRYLADKRAKLERLAILRDYRKMGIGKKLVEHIINYLKEKGIESIMLDSQEQAKNFYERIGFEKKGEVFEEAGIPHVEMWKKI